MKIKINRLVLTPPGFDRAEIKVGRSKGKHWGHFIKLTGEFVELYNDSILPKNLKGWAIRDAWGHKFTFPRKFIWPFSTLKLRTGSGKNTFFNIFWGRTRPVWNNEGDEATLIDSGGRVVDRKRYGDYATGSIEGHVYKAGTKTGLSNATVTTRLSANPNAPGKSVTTNNSGHYSIKNLAPAKYEVQAFRPGYVSETVKGVEVKRNQTTQKDFYLKPVDEKIDISVEKVEIIPPVPGWNEDHKIKVTFKNNSADVYRFETCLFRRKSSSDGWSEVPGARQSFGGVFKKSTTKDVTFTAPVKGWMDWDWYETTLGIASKNQTSRKIQYQIWFKATRDPDKPACEDTHGPVEVTVKVSRDKLDAFTKYNAAMVSCEASTATAVALTAAAAAAAAGIITAIGAGPLGIAAAVAWAAAAAAKLVADKQKEIMDDP